MNASTRVAMMSYSLSCVLVLFLEDIFADTRTFALFMVSDKTDYRKSCN